MNPNFVFEKERFDDVIPDGPEYHGFWLNFNDGEWAILGVNYQEDFLPKHITLNNYARWAINRCGVEEWVEANGFDELPEGDELFEWALQTLQAEFDVSVVYFECENYDGLIEIELEKRGIPIK